MNRERKVEKYPQQKRLTIRREWSFMQRSHFAQVRFMPFQQYSGNWNKHHHMSNDAIINDDEAFQRRREKKTRKIFARRHNHVAHMCHLLSLVIKSRSIVVGFHFVPTLRITWHASRSYVRVHKSLHSLHICQWYSRISSTHHTLHPIQIENKFVWQQIDAFKIYLLHLCTCHSFFIKKNI